MAKHEVLGIFNTFLDEATDNESFSFNITKSDKFLLKESVNSTPPLKVTKVFKKCCINLKVLPFTIDQNRPE